MKKLMALLVVAGMTFVACGNKTAEEEVVAEEPVVEEAAEVVEEPAAEAEVVEEAAEEVVAE